MCEMVLFRWFFCIVYLLIVSYIVLLFVMLVCSPLLSLNLPVLCMYLASSAASSGSPSSISTVMFFCILLTCCANAYLSCVYIGQFSRKCVILSASAPQAGQLAFSILLNLKRYSFNGM